MLRKPVSQNTKKKISNSLHSRFSRRSATVEAPVKKTNYTAIGAGLGATIGGVGSYLGGAREYDVRSHAGNPFFSEKSTISGFSGAVGGTLGAAGGALAGKGFGRVKKAKTKLGKAVGLGLMGTGLATAGYGPGTLAKYAYRHRND